MAQVNYITRSVQLKPYVWEIIDRTAEKEQISAAAVIRRIVNEYVINEEKKVKRKSKKVNKNS